MKTIKIKMKTLLRAIALAEERSNDWQAQCLEIAMIPAIADRWRELNPGFGTGLVVEFHPGNKFTVGVGFPIDCKALAGYTLCLMKLEGSPPYMWNRVRSEWYSHSASTCWNGMGRETICRFIEQLRMAALGHEPDAQVLRGAKVEIVDEPIHCHELGGES